MRTFFLFFLCLFFLTNVTSVLHASDSKETAVSRAAHKKKIDKKKKILNKKRVARETSNPKLLSPPITKNPKALSPPVSNNPKALSPPVSRNPKALSPPITKPGSRGNAADDWVADGDFGEDDFGMEEGEEAVGSQGGSHGADEKGIIIING